VTWFKKERAIANGLAAGFALDQGGIPDCGQCLSGFEESGMANHGLTLFAVGASRAYGARVAQHLDLVPGEHEERAFEDGEHKIRPLVEVRRQDVFVIHSLYGDAEQSPNGLAAF
jgi:N-terminal domain of ribose phosphate pyrophosphokinase